MFFLFLFMLNIVLMSTNFYYFNNDMNFSTDILIILRNELEGLEMVKRLC